MWLEAQLTGKTWALGTDFTLAYCAATPSLFYADWMHRISAAYSALRAYRARLLARTSFVRAMGEVRSFQPYFPLGRLTETRTHFINRRDRVRTKIGVWQDARRVK